MNCQVEDLKHTIISIEGNIGAGKSTLIKIMKQRYPDMRFIAEPVQQWQAINNDPNLNLLDQFYQDPKRWSYTMEVHAFSSRLKQWQMQLTDKNQEVFFSEQSPETNKEIFAQNNYENGFMNKLEFQLYKDFYQWLTEQTLTNQISRQIFVYLRVDPDICYFRIQKRARQEEQVILIKQSTITKEYLESIHNRHEIWLSNIPNVIILDGSADFDTDFQRQEILIAQLESALKGLI